MDQQRFTAKANNGGDDTVSGLTVMGYDAYYVALEALKAAGSTDPAAVNEALWDVTYTGVSGDISFNEIGDANRDAAYVKNANLDGAHGISWRSRALTQRTPAA